jgi:hypothetical protein
MRPFLGRTVSGSWSRWAIFYTSLALAESGELQFGAYGGMKLDVSERASNMPFLAGIRRVGRGLGCSDRDLKKPPP